MNEITKKGKSCHSPETLALYDKLISILPGISRKGASMPYTSLNGNMFSYIEKDGSFGIRLPEGPRDDFQKKYNSKPFVSFGMVMKEYVTVPDILFNNFKELKPWFMKSFEYAKILKPKPARKK